MKKKLTFAGIEVDLSEFGEYYKDEEWHDYCTEFACHGGVLFPELERRRLTGQGSVVYFAAGPLTIGGQYGGEDDAFYDLIGVPEWEVSGPAPAPRVWEALGFGEDISRSQGLALLRGWFPNRVMIRDRGWWGITIEDRPAPEFTPAEQQALQVFLKEAVPLFDVQQVLWAPEAHIKGRWRWIEKELPGVPLIPGKWGGALRRLYLHRVEWTDAPAKPRYKGNINEGTFSIDGFGLVVLSSGVAYDDMGLGTWRRRTEPSLYDWLFVSPGFPRVVGCEYCGSWLNVEGYPLSRCLPAFCSCPCHHYFQTIVVADRQFAEKLHYNFAYAYPRIEPLPFEVGDTSIKGTLPFPFE